MSDLEACRTWDVAVRCRWQLSPTPIVGHRQLNYVPVFFYSGANMKDLCDIFLSLAIKKVPNKIVLEKKMFLFFTVNISNTFHKQAHFACKSQILRGTCIMNCYAAIIEKNFKPVSLKQI